MSQETQQKLWKVVKSLMEENNFRAPPPHMLPDTFFFRQTQIFGSSGLRSDSKDNPPPSTSPTMCTALNVLVQLEKKLN